MTVHPWCLGLGPLVFILVLTKAPAQLKEGSVNGRLLLSVCGLLLAVVLVGVGVFGRDFWGWWLPVSWVLLLGGLLLHGLVFLDGGNPVRSRCDSAARSPQSSAVWARYGKPNMPHPTPELGQSRQPIQLQLSPEQNLALVFGRSRSVRVLDVDYTATATPSSGRLATSHRGLPAQDVQLDISQFMRGDGASLRPDRVLARARAVGGRLRISLCVERTARTTLGAPGRYRGVVSVIDPRVTRTDLPLEVTLAFPRWPLVLILLLLAVAAGTFVTWTIRERKPEDETFQIRCMCEWSTCLVGLVTIFAGSAAALAAFSTTYLSNPLWGESATDAVALLGVCFTAFVGAGTSLQLASLAQQARGQGLESAATANVGSDERPAVRR